MLVYGFVLLLVVILKVCTLLGLLFLSAGKVFALSFVFEIVLAVPVVLLSVLLIPYHIRDRPFNLQWGGYGFLFRSEFFFRTTRELEYLLCLKCLYACTQTGIIIFMVSQVFMPVLREGTSQMYHVFISIITQKYHKLYSDREHHIWCLKFLYLYSDREHHIWCLKFLYLYSDRNDHTCVSSE